MSILVEYIYEGYVMDFRLVQFPEFVDHAMEIYVKVSDLLLQTDLNQCCVVSPNWDGWVGESGL